MSSSLAALLAVALAATEPQATDELYAAIVPRDSLLGAIPVEQLEDVLLGALPPPPTTVVRQTRYYGTVTVDHRAHLARRARCKTCHGPGQVSKLDFTPRVAHERCIGCHQEQAKGPTKCQGCHVRTAPPATLVAAAPPPSAEPPRPPGPDPANVAAALAAFDARKGGAGGGAPGKEPFHRWFEVGLAAGHGQGISVRLASHQDFVVLTQSIERMSSGDEARTLGLFGAGVTRPVRSRVSFQAVGLTGFDVVDRPVVALFPAIGARAGVEWRPQLRFLQQVTVSVTGVVDLTGRANGGTTIFGTVATGFRVP